MDIHPPGAGRVAGWAAGWQAGAGRVSLVPSPTPSCKADEFAAGFSYEPEGTARVSQGRGGTFIISKRFRSCNHLFLDLERAGGQQGGREEAGRRQGRCLQDPACKGTPILGELLPPSTQTSPTLTHIHINIKHRKNKCRIPSFPASLPILCWLGPCRGAGECVVAVSPGQVPINVPALSLGDIQPSRLTFPSPSPSLFSASPAKTERQTGKST